MTPYVRQVSYRRGTGTERRRWKGAQGRHCTQPPLGSAPAVQNTLARCSNAQELQRWPDELSAGPQLAVRACPTRPPTPHLGVCSIRQGLLLRILVLCSRQLRKAATCWWIEHLSSWFGTCSFDTLRPAQCWRAQASCAATATATAVAAADPEKYLGHMPPTSASITAAKTHRCPPQSRPHQAPGTGRCRQARSR